LVFFLSPPLLYRKAKKKPRLNLVIFL